MMLKHRLPGLCLAKCLLSDSDSKLLTQLFHNYLLWFKMVLFLNTKYKIYNTLIQVGLQRINVLKKVSR